MFFWSFAMLHTTVPASTVACFVSLQRLSMFLYTMDSFTGSAALKVEILAGLIANLNGAIAASSKPKLRFNNHKLSHLPAFVERFGTMAHLSTWQVRFLSPRCWFYIQKLIFKIF